MDLPLSEALDEVFGTVLVDLPLLRLVIENIIECERLVGTNDVDLGFLRNIVNTLRAVVDLLLQCERSNTKRDPIVVVKRERHQLSDAIERPIEQGPVGSRCTSRDVLAMATYLTVVFMVGQK